MTFHRSDKFMLDPKGLLQWDFSGPQALTLLPAGHQPGYYDARMSLFVTTAGATGNVNAPVLAWSEPIFGAASLTFGNIAITATGLVFTVLRSFLSSGVNPITFTITPASVTGAPRGNLIAVAELKSLSVL